MIHSELTQLAILLLDPLPFARADSRVHARRQKAMQQKLTVVKASDPFSASQASRNRRGSMAADHINIENWVAEQQFSMSPDLQPESPVLSSPLEPPQDVEAKLPPSPPSSPNSALSVLPGMYMSLTLSFGVRAAIRCKGGRLWARKRKRQHHLIPMMQPHDRRQASSLKNSTISQSLGLRF